MDALELQELLSGKLGDKESRELLRYINVRPDLATKTDLEFFRTATKNDLESLRTATKNDLESLGAATKNDLESLRAATKNDLESLGTATKSDLERLETIIGTLATREYVEKVMGNLAWKVAGFLVAQAAVIVTLIKLL